MFSNNDIFEQWLDINKNIHKLYEAMNSQTWKMIGAVGFIVVFR